MKAARRALATGYSAGFPEICATICRWRLAGPGGITDESGEPGKPQALADLADG